MKRVVILLVVLIVLLAGCSSRNMVPENNDSETVTSAIVTFTFDDSTLDQYEIGYPILDAYDYNASLFVITGLVGKSFESHPMMSWEDIHALADDGWDIESHSYSHPYLTRLPIEDLDYELLQSYNDLLEQGLEPSIFAFPYGDYNDEVFSLASEYYPVVRGSNDGYNNNISNPNYLNSKWPTRMTNAATMEEWLNTAIDNDSWLIVMVHRIGDDPSDEFSVKPEVLKAFVDYIHEKGVPVKTMSEVLFP